MTILQQLTRTIINMNKFILKTFFICFSVIVMNSLSIVEGASSQIIMNDGRIYTGAFYPMMSVADLPENRVKRQDQGIRTEKIIVIDDQLRRIYVSKGSIREILSDELTPSYEIFHLPQKANHNPADQLILLDYYKSSTPFDNFGRRTLMAGGNPVVQGISEIAPNFIKAEGLNYNIDMRISPHSIPRKTLSMLIRKNINPGSLDDRLRIYQFYVQAELYEQASEELKEIIADFQGKQGSTQRLEVGLRMIRQLAAKRLISELELRQNSGQFRRVRELLQSFESNGVTPEKIQTVRRMLASYEEQDKKKKHISQRVTALHAALKDEGLKSTLDPLCKEIVKQLNINTMERFSEFMISEQDASLDDQARLAIALSGWLGGNIAVDNRLEIVASMYRVRQLIRKYLLESIPDQRDELWKQIQAEEASSPERVARLLLLMWPPKRARRSVSTAPYFYELETKSYLPDKTFKYYVQLPPEYDPNKTYPTVITLHGEKSSAKSQLTWWCGPWSERKTSKGETTFERLGQASRHGYIVIAPEWNESRNAYDYSAEAHAAVLYSMRDALKYFSIDTDRLFLSGHSAGGDAAWDIGLAHPDLWAGIIPICGTAEKFAYKVRKNIAYLPVYAVNGELDGAKLFKSKEVLDFGLDRSVPFDITYIQYKGRGNEPYSDELLRIFDWMQLKHRSFLTKDEKEVYTIRPWDNFFWTAELYGFPPEGLIDPSFWINKKVKNERIGITKFFKIVGNSVKIKSSADQARIFLAPEIFDFKQRGEVLFNMRKISTGNGIITPDVRVILEDARTRGDRKHPFWAAFSSEKEDKPTKSTKSAKSSRSAKQTATKQSAAKQSATKSAKSSSVK